jgi:Flp pilus assembly protein TadG
MIPRPILKKTHTPDRTAAAVVEFAILLPVIIVFVFGAIELANGIFLKQAVSIAAYEGTRTASNSMGTELAVISRVSEVLSSRGITEKTISITPSLATATRGTPITVTVTVPASQLQSVSPLKYLHNKSFIRSVRMVRL